MNVPSVTLLAWIGHATAAVLLAAVAVWLLLRLTRLQSPALHQFAWLAVLLQGIVFWRITVELPVLPATDLAAVAARPADVREAEQPRTTLRIESANADAPALPTPPENAMPGGAQVVEIVWPWSSIVLGVWLCGIVVIIARACVRYVSFCRALPPPRPPRLEWVQELTQVCDELAIPRRRLTL